MKKSIILLTVLVLVSTFLLAVPKKPLFEIFTSSTCPPCANANPILDEVLGENPGQYSLIKYQASWPGSGDPYYIPETGVRTSYYGVTGVPQLVSNGANDDVWNFTQDHFDAFLTEETGLSLSVVASIDDNNLVTVETTVDADQAYAADLKFYAAVLEKITVGNVGSNYETDFYNVLMALNPDGYGMSLDAFNAGSQLDLIDTFDMNTTFMEQPNDLVVVVFIQDDTDHELIQSEMVEVTGTFDDYDVIFNISDAEGNLVEDADLFLEEYGTKFSDANGQIFYEGVFPGDYDYDVFKAGLFPNSGVVEIIDQNVTVDIILDIPGDYFYEDFGVEIPADWTVHATSPDFLYWFDGHVILFRQNNTAPLMIISPEIDLGPGETLFFEAGNQSGDPLASFGLVTDPTDPTTFVIFEEFSPGTTLEEYSYDISDLTGAGYLAWQLVSTSFSYFDLDNVRIEADQTALYPPTGLAVDSVTGLFTWEAPAIDEITGYDVYLDGTLQGNIEELEWQFNNLVNGTSYSAGVVAVYDEGDSEMVTIGFTYNGTDANDDFLLSQPVLNQNYPNPFNPTTTISFTLPTGSMDEAELIIYNLKGQIVKHFSVILSGVEGSIIWNGTDKNDISVSSGIYLYKLKSGDFTSSKKMILMK
jgi:thiol-disulfide isomerase/thioredoxin